MDTEIEQVKQEIRDVQEQIHAVEVRVAKAATEAKKLPLRRREERLWNREEQLRKRSAAAGKGVALAQGADKSDSAYPQAARQSFQLFVQSARGNYLEWEHSSKEFLEVKGDLFTNFSGAFLIWVRKCYIDLKNILVKEAKEVGQRFILLGTAGIGKSFFTIFWVCYLATQEKRVVWRLASGLYYLLDFSQEAVPALCLGDTLSPALLKVVDDPASWLIIDGEQKDWFGISMQYIASLFSKKENHHEFGKGHRVKTWYLPVWTEDEIKSFCDAFVEHKSEFSAMDVPGKVTALANFKELGGVPRYVLCAGKMEQGRNRLEQSLGGVSVDTCLQVYSGQFDPQLSDMLIHMFVDEESGKYTSFEYNFACSDVRHKVEEQFWKVAKPQVVHFLQQHINTTNCGSLWGSMYESVAHVILSQGGKFKRKRVSETGCEVPDEVQQQKLKPVTFTTLQELTKLKDDFPDGAYCQPSSLNFESADAVIVPGTLVQYFKLRKGNHGYKIHGLKELDDALNLEKYSLWACVPRETYEGTNFQNWVTTKGTKYKYKDMTSEVQGLVQKMQQYVVQVDYRK